MTSAAHQEWQVGRAKRLQRLFDAHAAAEGSGARGRRWRTQEINWALTFLLAAEFQGFARDLHDEAGRSFARFAAQGNATLETIFKARVTQNRQLDKGNAQPASLGNDFKILGVDLWADLKAKWPMKTAKWNSNLEELNKARNAIAHSNAGVLANTAISLDAVRRWRSSLDGLAGKMDDVVGTNLTVLFNVTSPWQP